jgi:hypothetical protein
VIREAIEADWGGGLVIAVDHGSQQEFSESNAGIVVDHRFDKAPIHGDGSLTEVGIDDQIEGLKQGAEVADRTFLIKDFAGKIGPGVTDELHVRSREIVHWAVGQHTDAGIRRAILPEIIEAETGELLPERAPILGND